LGACPVYPQFAIMWLACQAHAFCSCHMIVQSFGPTAFQNVKNAQAEASKAASKKGVVLQIQLINDSILLPSMIFLFPKSIVLSFLTSFYCFRNIILV
jgi:hypothetical protein